MVITISKSLLNIHCNNVAQLLFVLDEGPEQDLLDYQLRQQRAIDWMGRQSKEVQEAHQRWAQKNFDFDYEVGRQINYRWFHTKTPLCIVNSTSTNTFVVIKFEHVIIYYPLNCFCA